ncbi:MAG TPA: LLM class F420-dependent oxidoreductase [Gammaproteobacteria bacterium]|nr:LLM class F420-dependent oxidoreductase [Gammaproteobacteria bacterium]|tara:strand:- start:159 stop:1001 length:843 start_codon:yes stop_codon:yes gene_type:complete
MKIGVSLPVRELENDIGAIRAFAQLAEELGFTHLRVPDQVLRPGSGPLHEPMTLMSYIAAITSSIELVPSVIVLPLRQTALVAKQVAELDILSAGRVRLGVGVGGNEQEYKFMNQSFRTRGARCTEQMALLRLLWTKKSVTFHGRWDKIDDAGLTPMPIQRPIPIWIGAKSIPSDSVINRIGLFADGWFVLCSPEEFPQLQGKIQVIAEGAGRNPTCIGTEAGVAVVGPREDEWRQRVLGWRKIGLTHLCLRTLGGGLKPRQHLDKLKEVCKQLPQTMGG